MLSSLFDGTDKSGTAFPTFCTLATEEALVVDARGGNELAFEILVERYRYRMVGVALRLTRVKEDAEDVTQQSFQKAFIHLHRFEGKSSFCIWLTRITVNEALMLLRRDRGRREISINEKSCELKEAARLEIPGSDSAPQVSYSQREEAGILTAAIDTLTPEIRKAIELRDIAELSTEETARPMGLSLAAVKSRLLRGRRKLRKALRCYVTSPRRARAIAGDAKRVSRDRL